MKLKPLIPLLIASVFIASCENNHAASVGGTTTHHNSSATITEQVENKPIYRDILLKKQQVDKANSHAHTQMEMSFMMPQVVGEAPDIEQDILLTSGIVSSILWGTGSVTLAPIAGLVAVVGFVDAFIDVIFGGHNTAVQMGQMQQQITDLQTSVTELQYGLTATQNMFYNEIAVATTSTLYTYSSQYYHNGYDYLSSTSNTTNINDIVLSSFKTANKSGAKPTIKIESMGDLTNTKMLAVISDPDKMEDLVYELNTNAKTFDENINNISNSYIKYSSACSSGGGNPEQSCFLAVKRNTDLGGSTSSSLLTLLHGLNVAEQARIRPPASKITELNIYGNNAYDVFEQGNKYVTWYGNQSAFALQQAYNNEFIINWINYTFGTKFYKQYKTTMKQIDFNKTYQIKPLTQGLKNNTYFNYSLGDDESSNKQAYLMIQRNLQNVYYARMSVLNETLMSHIVSDHLVDVLKYQTPQRVYQDKTKHKLDGVKVVYDEAKLTNLTIEAKSMLAQVMPLPVRNPYRDSDKDKPQNGLFYVDNDLRSMPVCYDNYKKGLIKDRKTFDQYCPSVYNPNMNAGIDTMKNVYDMHKFSIGIVAYGQYRVSLGNVYPHIGYRCNFTNPKYANTFNIVSARVGPGNSGWDYGFSCYPNLDKDVIEHGMSANDPHTNDTDQRYRFFSRLGSDTANTQLLYDKLPVSYPYLGEFTPVNNSTGNVVSGNIYYDTSYHMYSVNTSKFRKDHSHSSTINIAVPFATLQVNQTSTSSMPYLTAIVMHNNIHEGDSVWKTYSGISCIAAYDLLCHYPNTAKTPGTSLIIGPSEVELKNQYNTDYPANDYSAHSPFRMVSDR